MTEAAVLRYVRITNSGKLSDRFVTTQVKEASDLDARHLGRLFAIVEIENPWFPSSQIGQTIINTAAREYFKAADDDALTRFELALKKVNETLGHLASTGESDWAEHLHAVIALQTDDQLHIASTGGVRGWLIRDKKGSPIFEPGGAASPPAKTFSSVLSGVLEPGDRLVLASSGLFKVINQTEFKSNIVAADSLVSAAVRLANILKAKRGQWVNAIVIDYQTASAVANAPAHTLPDTLYLDAGNIGDWRLTMNQAIQRGQAGVVKVGSHLSRLNKHIDRFIRTTLLPRSKQAFNQSRDWSSKQLQEFQTKTLPAVKQQAASIQKRVQQTRPPEPVVDPEPVDIGNESIIGKSVFAINDYQAGGVLNSEIAPELDEDDRVHHYIHAPQAEPLPTQQPAKPTPRFKLPILPIQKLTLPALGSKRPLMFGGIALVLLIILVFNLKALTGERSEGLSRTQAAQKLTILQDKLEEAKLAKIFNQTDKAIEAAETVVAGATELASSPLASDATEVASEAQDVLDELTATTRLTAEELATVTGTALVAWGDQISIATASGIQSIKDSGGEMTTLPLPNGEGLAALTGFDEKSGIAILTDAPATYQASSASGPLEFITPGDGSWKRGVAIAPFFNNLYILTPDDNAIWRYIATEGQYGAGEEYITDGTSVTGAVDLAIDGSVYVLKSDGEILKLTRGKREEFRVRDVPKPTDTFSTPKQIEAADEALYVLESNRVVKLATDGRFQNQYALDGNEPITGFAIKDGTLYLLTETRLVKASL